MEQFKKAAAKSSNVNEHQFWRHNNKPIELWSNKVIWEKINYVHNNPVAQVWFIAFKFKFIAVHQIMQMKKDYWTVLWYFASMFESERNAMQSRTSGSHSKSAPGGYAEEKG